MFPGGMSPKQMQTVMKRMGIKVEEIVAERVIIQCADKNIIITNPQVMLTKMPNQEMFQISGDVSEDEKGSEEEVETEITQEDVEVVMDQTGVDRKTAEDVLEETRGDIALAILKLKKSDLTSDMADK
jgi:nascent polypeptide-associated complex subunit alpha